MKTAWGAVWIGIALVVSAALFTHAFRTRSRANHRVAVVGSGTRDFDADLISWKADFTRQDKSLKEAYNQLNADREKVRAFLLAHGATEKDLVFSSIATEKETQEVTRKDGSRSTEFTGYRLTQSVQVESPECDKYEQISRNITDLINAGIELTSEPPAYFFTKLAELKLEIVAAASKDARERAEQIAANAGGKLGRPSDANLGVFQITARNSSEEFSWKGNYNTASRHKTAMVTLRLEYEVE